MSFYLKFPKGFLYFIETFLHPLTSFSFKFLTTSKKKNVKKTLLHQNPILKVTYLYKDNDPIYKGVSGSKTSQFIESSLFELLRNNYFEPHLKHEQVQTVNLHLHSTQTQSHKPSLNQPQRQIGCHFTTPPSVNKRHSSTFFFLS